MMFKDGLKDILPALRFLLRQVLIVLFPRPEEVKENPIINEPVKPVPPSYPAPVAEAYKWDTPENARHSTRVICDEEDLKFAEKNLICAVIMAESGFKNSAKCINKRKDGTVSSTDWGICQINDYWHVGQGKSFPSVEYVLQNPDKVVRWMIKMYRGGSLKLWVAYTNGSYKKYL
jgi:hypothetical protein